jgi:hypothetical protein
MLTRTLFQQGDNIGMRWEDVALIARQVGRSRLEQSLGRFTLFADQSATGFVYFKRRNQETPQLSDDAPRGHANMQRRCLRLEDWLYQPASAP